ncbi:hypothetical protein ZIOFF_004857 [Zingiber officinale]|uniref:J domain-containing protein n=1 Tax=Zingiber officinale TaxID=94328 RepID=A0A8J5LUJ9_ZINOF|nr:hypothetical protein ZIOFF_004857 [Zingiber officinale]
MVVGAAGAATAMAEAETLIRGALLTLGTRVKVDLPTEETEERAKIATGHTHPRFASKEMASRRQIDLKMITIDHYIISLLALQTYQLRVLEAFRVTIRDILSKKMAALALSCPSNSLYRSSFAPIPAKSTVAAAPRLRVSASATDTMYDLLSVSRTAGPSEIRAAYRRVALRWHPDACRTAGEERRYAERFMEAREAYEVLCDPVRRRDYDLALSGDRWAAAVGAGPAFREGRPRRRGGAAGHKKGAVIEIYTEGRGSGRIYAEGGNSKVGEGSSQVGCEIDEEEMMTSDHEGGGRSC